MFKESMERIGIKPPGAGYKTSRDYEALWEVINKGYEVVAFSNNPLWGGRLMIPVAYRNGCLGYSIPAPGGFSKMADHKSLEDLLRDCKELDLEFIMPDVES